MCHYVGVMFLRAGGLLIRPPDRRRIYFSTGCRFFKKDLSGLTGINLSANHSCGPRGSSSEVWEEVFSAKADVGYLDLPNTKRV